ncbi:MAG: Zn-dependent protease, partial [Bacteroidota bacterium]
GKTWIDRKVDLRIDDHPEPLKEMRRLLRVHQAYGHMNAGDLAIEKGEIEKAMEEYSAAEAMFPNNLEMQYWHAVTLSNIGKVDEALPMFKKIFKKDKNWLKLTPRLTQNGLLTVSKEDLERILSAHK